MSFISRFILTFAGVQLSTSSSAEAAALAQTTLRLLLWPSRSATSPKLLRPPPVPVKKTHQSGLFSPTPLCDLCAVVCEATVKGPFNPLAVGSLSLLPLCFYASRMLWWSFFMSTMCPAYFRFVLFNLASLQLLLLFYAKVLTKDAGVFLTVVPDPAWLDSCWNSEAPLALNGPSQASRWWVELLCHPKRKREGNTPVSFFLCQHNGLSSWWALNSSLPRRRGLPGSWSIHLLSGSADDVMTVRSSSEFLLRVILVRCLTSH